METLHESKATDGMKCKVPYEYKGKQANSAIIVSRVTLIGLLVFNSFNMYCVWPEILICLYWTYLIRLKQEGIVCFNKKWSRYYGRGLHRYHGSTLVTQVTGPEMKFSTIMQDRDMGANRDLLWKPSPCPVGSVMSSIFHPVSRPEGGSGISSQSRKFGLTWNGGGLSWNTRLPLQTGSLMHLSLNFPEPKCFLFFFYAIH